MTEGITSTRVQPLFSDQHGIGLSNGSTPSDAEDREFNAEAPQKFFRLLGARCGASPSHFLTESIASDIFAIVVTINHKDQLNASLAFFLRSQSTYITWQSTSHRICPAGPIRTQ